MTSFDSIADQLAHQAIELPSWAFGNSGTRFKVFGTPGRRGLSRRSSPTPRKVTQAHRVWRRRWRCTSRGTRWTTTPRSATTPLILVWQLGTINSNTFQDDIYKFGSLTHVDESVRRKAIDHHFECIEIMNLTGSGT